ncbi:TenA family transcriptional regulator [Azotobacter armeniacus]
MDFHTRLQEQTAAERDYLLAAPLIGQALQGQLSLASYLAFLGQAYHHVKHTVPLLMACGARLPEWLEWLREAIAEYIEEEYGHHEWILNDIRACGGDAEAVRKATPNLPTELMISYVYDRINRGSPVSFFGMVQVLEGTSVAVATRAAGSIQASLGLPPQAFSYLTSHGSLDLEHIELFKRLMKRLEDGEDQVAVVHTAKVVYRLYGDLLRSLPLTA